MAELFESLYAYAEENLVMRFQQETTAERRAAQHRADKLTDQLISLAPDAEKRVEELKRVWDTLNDYHDQAVFLSGLSIGMELGRL